MFLFRLDHPLLCDSIQYWTRWEKNEFIDETLEAIKYLTPKFTESPKKRPEKKSYYSSIEKWAKNHNKNPFDYIQSIERVTNAKSATLVRWPIEISIYENSKWNPVFQPPHCPLNFPQPDLPEYIKEIWDKCQFFAKYQFFAPEYTFFMPIRTSYQSNLEKAIEDWQVSDKIWLDYAFDLIEKSIPHILEKHQTGEAILAWIRKNEYEPPLFYNDAFHAYHIPSKKMVSLANNDDFMYLCKILN
jgi:hypothetical protein